MLVEKLTACGLLKVVCGTDTLGVGVNVTLSERLSRPMPFQIRMGIPEMEALWLDLSTRSNERIKLSKLAPPKGGKGGTK